MYGGIVVDLGSSALPLRLTFVACTGCGRAPWRCRQKQWNRAKVHVGPPCGRPTARHRRKTPAEWWICGCWGRSRIDVWSMWGPPGVVGTRGSIWGRCQAIRVSIWGRAGALSVFGGRGGDSWSIQGLARDRLAIDPGSAQNRPGVEPMSARAPLAMWGHRDWWRSSYRDNGGRSSWRDRSS